MLDERVACVGGLPWLHPSTGWQVSTRMQASCMSSHLGRGHLPGALRLQVSHGGGAAPPELVPLLLSSSQSLGCCRCCWPMVLHASPGRNRWPWMPCSVAGGIQLRLQALALGRSTAPEVLAAQLLLDELLLCRRGNLPCRLQLLLDLPRLLLHVAVQRQQLLANQLHGREDGWQ